ncbi:MAG: hypothetical protein ACI82S_000789 [Patiriisocius sp.]|jgi:hypothetical protein
MALDNPSSPFLKPTSEALDSHVGFCHTIEEVNLL